LLIAQTSDLPPRQFKNSLVYAGIEVGSKGVKMSILEVDRKSTEPGAHAVLKDSTINTDFISFSPVTFSATSDGLKQLYLTARNKYLIPAERIYTAISSGVNAQAIKEKKKDLVQLLIDSFQLQINEPNRNVSIISVEDEARLSHLGIVPEKERYNTFLIDIGSGNTKGGYFPDNTNNTFKLFQLNWGTKSTTNTIVKQCGNDKGIANYIKTSRNVLNDVEKSDIIYAINASGSYPANDHIAFSGGIPWAVATLLKPELLHRSVVTVTYAEIVQFYERIATNYVSISDSAITSNLKVYIPEKHVVAKVVKNIHKVFDQQSLLGGTGLLVKIMRQFESVNEKKQFYFIKNGATGWISAYVSENNEP
jgi:hypothetical protein